MSDLALMAAVILLPIVPAVLIFKLIPGNSVVVSGPFKGLRLNLGGAFAAYFLIMLVALELENSVLRPERYERWQVSGNIGFQPGQGTFPSPTDGLMLVIPPRPGIDKSGHISFAIALDQNIGGLLDMSQVTIDYSGVGYQTVTMPLDPDGRHTVGSGAPNLAVRVDKKNREFDLGTIVLQKTSR
jgi:hypothetical protein